MADSPSPATVAASDRALRDIAEDILDDADAVGARITERLLRDVPEISADPLSIEETRRSSRATLVALLGGWRRGEPPERVAAPPELLFQVGITARDGIPLGPLLRILHVAHGEFADIWGARTAEAGLSPEVQALAMRRGHQLTFAWFDGLMAQLTVTYEEEAERVARTPERLRREAVEAALSGKTVNLDALSRTAAYEFRRRHIGLVLWRGTPISDGVPAVLDAQPAFAAQAREIAEELGSAPPLVVASASSVAWAWVAVREAPSADRLLAVVEAARPEGVSVAFGEPAPGLEGFRITHDDALTASRVAMLQGGDASGSTVPFDAVELTALVAGDLHRARRFVLRQLGLLAADDEETGRLRATLRVYLEEQGGRTATAERLGVHPNTVSNRVRASEALIGRSLRDRPVELQVALALRETLGEQVA
ncbi:MAG: PucR family transcriptional regulator [Solirubrobacteraceae bacterium]